MWQWIQRHQRKYTDRGELSEVRWPVFQHSDIDLVTDDRKMSVEAGLYVNVGGKDFHSIATFK